MRSRDTGSWRNDTWFLTLGKTLTRLICAENGESSKMAMIHLNSGMSGISPSKWANLRPRTVATR